ncbi:hypothetical protein GIB67_024134 [Kingdonia uniflora]|uniref:Uncharacterized protein n=1 Tax=Kingdonia uniflora TaxID=39325 RepID=A0A7J7MMX7_9MAGN|nr:hypothetical protein GIB67_024134 [Kingdonia uniflora]
MGFFMTVFMFALVIPYHHWTLKANHIGFVVMYALTFFFANFGPNATCHGISAAAGKAGAMVGAFGFLYASQNKDPTKTDKGYPARLGMRNALMVLRAINLLGFFFTFLVPEAKGRALEEMSGENEKEDNSNIAKTAESA